MDLDAVAAAITTAHRRLLDQLAGLDDGVARRPSKLPGWSVGHVLTHLARNADSLTRGFEGAAKGEVWERYPGGDAQRTADIEQGAGRPAADLIADVKAANDRFEAALASAAERGWEGSYRGPGDSALPITELPHKRWREVECHTADLGLGYAYTDWPVDYARDEVRRFVEAVGPLPEPVEALAVHDQAAWVMGRIDVPGAPGPGQWY